MPQSVIAQYLLTDVVDHTAAEIRALNPGVWTSDGDVPVYLYTSLCTLWTGSSGNVSALRKSLIYKSGQGQNKSADNIVIDGVSSESAFNPDSRENEGPAYSDEYGAENISLSILFQTTATPTQNLTKNYNADLRVRLLLDAKFRGLCGVSQSVPILPDADKSIDRDHEFLGLWEGFLTNQAANQLVSVYTFSFVRSYARAIIPS